MLETAAAHSREVNVKPTKSVRACAALAIATLLLSGAAEASPKPKKLAVMDIANLQGVPADSAKILTNIVVAEIARAGGYSVISTAEISAMIGFEKQKQLLGCTDNSSCLAEIGGALGVDYFVNGQVGKIGSRYHLNLALTDVVKATVAARETRYAEFGNEDALVVATEDAVRAILAGLHAAKNPAAVAW